VKLIYLVRDPIVRMRSHYQHRVALGAETESPEVALLENPIYLAYSKYAMQLERYLEHFPREQLLVITSESLRNDRADTVGSVYEFLGVDPTLSPPALETEFYTTAQRRSYPPLVWKVRRLLKRHVPQAKRAKELVDSMMARRSGAAAPSSTGAPADAVISPELRVQLAELLRDDVARLRGYMPPSFDGWGLA
jgi:Sulfotransferase domain